MNTKYFRNNIKQHCIKQFGVDPFDASRKPVTVYQRTSIVFVLKKYFKYREIAKIMNPDKQISNETINYHISKAKGEMKIYPDRKAYVNYWRRYLDNLVIAYNQEIESFVNRLANIL